MTFLADWKRRAKELKRDTYAIYLACRDPRVSWSTRAVAACVITYALSPIDLIPDFIPVLGYLDDLILVPLGVALVLKMLPKEVLAECRENAQTLLDQKRPRSWVGATLIVGIWLLVVAMVLRAVL